MIGQMQGLCRFDGGLMTGKYQLVVFPDAGHFVHEDLPSRTGEALIELWRRNDREAIKRIALLNQQKHL
jgi:pimeloyl-ACP methyl ester carboxylesterase